MKKILLLLLLGATPLAHTAHGERRAALVNAVRLLYRIATEKPPKKTIIVPPYSIMHSLKIDVREIKTFFQSIGNATGYVISHIAPESPMAQKIGTLAKKYALYWTSGSLIAFALFIVYNAVYHADPEERKQYRAVAIATPASFFITYLAHKMGQYRLFKEKYRRLIAANK